MAKTILTVDDAMTIRKMVSLTLENAGHKVIEAPDGAVALNLLRSCPVDLVITDIHMPNMNGIELIRQLRMLPSFVKTPILLLTTESDPAKKAEGRAAGATGWILKPFSQQQLLATVAKLLPQKQTASATEDISQKIKALQNDTKPPFPPLTRSAAFKTRSVNNIV